MVEKETGRSRGFGFVVMKNTSDVHKVINNPSNILDGKPIDCKKAVPKEKGSANRKSTQGAQNEKSKKMQNDTGNNSVSGSIGLQPGNINQNQKLVSRHSYGVPNTHMGGTPGMVGLQNYSNVDQNMPFQINSTPYGSEILNMAPISNDPRTSDFGQMVSNQAYTDSTTDPELMVSQTTPLRYSVGAKIVKSPQGSN